MNTRLNTTYLYYHVFKQLIHSIGPLLFRYVSVQIQRYLNGAMAQPIRNVFRLNTRAKQ